MNLEQLKAIRREREEDNQQSKIKCNSKNTNSNSNSNSNRHTNRQNKKTSWIERSSNNNKLNSNGAVQIQQLQLQQLVEQPEELRRPTRIINLQCLTIRKLCCSTNARIKILSAQYLVLHKILIRVRWKSFEGMSSSRCSEFRIEKCQCPLDDKKSIRMPGTTFRK